MQIEIREPVDLTKFLERLLVLRMRDQIDRKRFLDVLRAAEALNKRSIIEIRRVEVGLATVLPPPQVATSRAAE